MIFHNINPVLLDLGVVSIRYYGLVYVIGFLIAYFLLVHFAGQNKIQNLTREKTDEYLLWLMIGLIIGARLFEVLFWEPKYYFSNPAEIIMIWHGGMSFHGGLFGAAFVSYFFCKKHKIKFYDLADLLVIPVAIMLFFGRIANFINGELWGKPTGVSWLCIDYSKSQFMSGLPSGCRHPSQVYEALKNAFIFGVLVFMKGLKLPKGFLFWSFAALYGYLRFIVNIWREDTPILLGFSIGQILSFLMGILGTIMLVVIWRKNGKNINKNKRLAQKK